MIGSAGFIVCFYCVCFMVTEFWCMVIQDNVIGCG